MHDYCRVLGTPVTQTDNAIYIHVYVHVQGMWTEFCIFLDWEMVEGITWKDGEVLKGALKLAQRSRPLQPSQWHWQVCTDFIGTTISRTTWKFQKNILCRYCFIFTVDFFTVKLISEFNWLNHKVNISLYHTLNNLCLFSENSWPLLWSHLFKTSWIFSEIQFGTHTGSEPRRTPFCQMAYQITFIVFLGSIAWKNVVGYDFLSNMKFGICKKKIAPMVEITCQLFPSFNLNRLANYRRTTAGSCNWVRCPQCARWFPFTRIQSRLWRIMPNIENMRPNECRDAFLYL